MRGETVVDSLEELARIPAEAQYLVVQKASDALLEAVARHRPLRSLGIPGNRPFPLDVLAHAPELTSLLLGHSYEAEELRKLRHAPKLQHLYLTGQAEFDEARGMAVAELRFLRTLLVVGGEPTPAGIAALTNLNDLECLLVGVSREQGRNDWLHELPKLRRLEALVFVAGSHPPDFATTLALMPNLRLLELRSCDDQVLAALPQKLERLVVSSLGAVSESAIRSLAKRENLRGLGFRAGLSNPHDHVCELVRALPLERFDARVGAPSPELWDELQRKPRLRHLSLDGKGGSTAEILAAAARCQSLETLELSLLALPKPRELVPLTELRHLRRIDIEIDPSPRQFHAPSPELKELRALFAGRVEILVD